MNVVKLEHLNRTSPTMTALQAFSTTERAHYAVSVPCVILRLPSQHVATRRAQLTVPAVDTPPARVLRQEVCITAKCYKHIMLK